MEPRLPGRWHGKNRTWAVRPWALHLGSFNKKALKWQCEDVLLKRTQYHTITISYTSWWISLSSGVHVPPADCQRKINQVELLWKPSPRPLKPKVTGSCAKPLNLKTGINSESSNVFRWNSSKCVNNDVFVSLFGLWLLASELQNGQCPGAWQSLLPLPRSSHTSHETSNFKWKSWGRKEWSKVGIRKIGCIQLQGLRNVRGSKRFGFFLCLGYGAMAYLGQETGWRERHRKGWTPTWTRGTTSSNTLNTITLFWMYWEDRLTHIHRILKIWPWMHIIPWARCSAKPADKIGVLQTLLTFFDHTNCSFQSSACISTDMFWKNHLRVPSWTPWWKSLDSFCSSVLFFARSTHLGRSRLIDRKYLNKYHIQDYYLNLWI